MPMIPSPIHFLAYTRPSRPVVEPRGAAGCSNYNPLFAYDFCRGGGDDFDPKRIVVKTPFLGESMDVVVMSCHV